MSNILTTLQDGDGNNVFPRTSTGAVVNGQGQPLDSVLDNKVNTSSLVPFDIVKGDGSIETVRYPGYKSNMLVKLWENPNPNNAFSAQTINLDLSGYNLILMTARNFAEQNGGGYCIAEVGGETSSLISSMYPIDNFSTGETHLRLVKATSTGIQISTAKYGTSGNNNDNRCIPQKIYGINPAPVLIPDWKLVWENENPYDEIPNNTELISQTLMDQYKQLYTKLLIVFKYDNRTGREAWTYSVEADLMHCNRVMLTATDGAYPVWRHLDYATNLKAGLCVNHSFQADDASAIPLKIYAR